jgi:hypothetical protein
MCLDELIQYCYFRNFFTGPLKLFSTREQSSTYQAYVLCQDASNDPFNRTQFFNSQELNNLRCENDDQSI